MTTVDLSLLAGLVVRRLRQHVADPSPVRDATETDLVDLCFRRGCADEYVQARLVDASRRLATGCALGDEAWRTGDVVTDALIALGGYAHLQDLQAGVAA